jgi:hypothetical protein
LILREQLPRSGTAKRMQKPRFRLRPLVARFNQFERN